jgi:hypothetical protein
VSGEVTVTLQQGATSVPYVVPLSGTGLTRTSATCGVTAVCPSAMTVDANTTVTLNPTVMAATNTTCAWGILSRPVTSNGTFSAPSSCSSTTYFADVAGTHTVNLTASDALGGVASCSTQVTVKPKGDLWVELTWDRPNDVDLHLLHPMGGDGTTAAPWAKYPWDCFYANRNPPWNLVLAAENPTLDRDDTSQMGPENTRIDSPSHDLVYTIGVHMFRGSVIPITNTVKVYCAGTLVTTRTKALSAVQDLWVVGTVDFKRTKPCVFTPIDQVLSKVHSLQGLGAGK